MGFNKRFLTKESILSTYTSSGLDGVKSILRSSDAIIFGDDFSSEIVDMYNEVGESCDLVGLWKAIEKTIADELPN
tara:strand:+ start:2293 stop:2520 length:228 start_codon:yes stop_codon:yes gene_type:complete